MYLLFLLKNERTQIKTLDSKSMISFSTTHLFSFDYKIILLRSFGIVINLHIKL